MKRRMDRMARPCTPWIALASLLLAACIEAEPPEPVADGELLAEGQYVVMDLAFQDGELIWGRSDLNQGGVVTVLTPGQDPVSHAVGAYRFALAGSTIYACSPRESSATGRLVRIDRPTGTVEPLLETIDCDEVAFSQGELFLAYTALNDQAGPGEIPYDRVIARIDPNQPQAQTVLLRWQGNNEAVREMWLDDSHIYWSTGLAIHRAGRDGGEPEVLVNRDSWVAAGADGDSAVIHAVMDDDHIYFTLHGYYSEQPTDGLMEMGKDGSELRVLSYVETAHALAIDGDTVCWAEGKGNRFVSGDGVVDAGMGDVFCQQRSGGEPVTVARLQNGPIAMALGDGFVHWANRSGTIRRSPKPAQP
jgi:hypothetical protein